MDELDSIWGWLRGTFLLIEIYKNQLILVANLPLTKSESTFFGLGHGSTEVPVSNGNVQNPIPNRISCVCII